MLLYSKHGLFCCRLRGKSRVSGQGGAGSMLSGEISTDSFIISFSIIKGTSIMKPRPLDPTLKERARSMRKCMTPQESRIWIYCLKKLPYHFRRQDVASPFIADFTCRKAKLVIEVDGIQHCSDCGKGYDEWRSRRLNGKGYMVLRFSNEDIEKRFDIVCDMVLRITETRIKELEGKL